MSREIDIEVAKVLGWTDLDEHAYTPSGELLCGTPPPGVRPMWLSGRSTVPYYSTVISVAMSLIAVAAERGYKGFEMSVDYECQEAAPEQMWCAAFAKDAYNFRLMDTVEEWSYGPTAAAAICVAFLGIHKPTPVTEETGEEW